MRNEEKGRTKLRRRAGNVQVSPTHLGSPSDVIVPFLGKPTFARSMKAFKAWAVKAHLQGGGGAPVIMQLCHTGSYLPFLPCQV